MPAEAHATPWRTIFTHDAAHDIVTARFVSCVLATPGDVLRWRRDVEAHFERYGRKVDLLIDLEGLVVKPSAARSFGTARREVLAKFTNRSFRYNGDSATRTTIFTSSVIDGADANIYASRQEAIEALLEDRKRHP